LKNQENLKRQKLRNNEYYQMQDIQDRLYMQNLKGTKCSKSYTHSVKWKRLREKLEIVSNP